MKRARLIAPCVLALVASAAPAWGSWSSPGTGAGSGVAASLSPAAVSVPGSATNSVTVTWSQQASFVPSAPANSQITYILERRLDSGAYAAVSSGDCAGSQPFNTTSCVDNPPSSGSYSYRVVASAGSWTATSAGSSAVAVTVSGPVVQSITPLDADPSNAATLRWTVSFSEAVTGVGLQDFALARGGTLIGGSVSTVTGSGASYTVTASTGTGSGALGLNVVDDDSIADALSLPLGGPGTGNGDFSGETYTVDRSAPAVSSILRAGTDPTNASSVQWTVTFGEPVSGVDSGDFTLARGGGLTGGTITAVTGSGTTYTVTSGTGTGTGTLGLDLADDDTIADAAGNPLGGPGVGNGNFSGQAYSVDRTAPTASSIVTADANPTNAATVGWTVTFSEAVSGVDAADFALARTGTVSASAAIQSVTGSGTTRTVTATTVSGEGTLGLDLAGNGTILDGAGNALSAGVTGQAYTIDRTAPAQTALQMLDTNANGKIDRVTVTFGETLASSSATAPWTLANVPSGEHARVRQHQRIDRDPHAHRGRGCRQHRGRRLHRRAGRERGRDPRRRRQPVELHRRRSGRSRSAGPHRDVDARCQRERQDRPGDGRVQRDRGLADHRDRVHAREHAQRRDARRRDREHERRHAGDHRRRRHRDDRRGQLHGGARRRLDGGSRRRPQPGVVRGGGPGGRRRSGAAGRQRHERRERWQDRARRYLRRRLQRADRRRQPARHRRRSPKTA